MKTGLFFGSFNPIHTGHLIIASYMAGFTGLKDVWLVVSPHNPLKNRTNLSNMYDRLEMILERSSSSVTSSKLVLESLQQYHNHSIRHNGSWVALRNCTARSDVRRTQGGFRVVARSARAERARLGWES